MTHNDITLRAAQEIYKVELNSQRSQWLHDVQAIIQRAIDEATDELQRKLRAAESVHDTQMRMGADMYQTALRRAEQAEQALAARGDAEPVGTVYEYETNGQYGPVRKIRTVLWKKDVPIGASLYAAPPAKPQLSNEEKRVALESNGWFPVPGKPDLYQRIKPDTDAKPQGDPRVSDMAMLLKRCARALNSSGDKVLSTSVMDYLLGKGLAGSPLREEPVEPQPESYPGSLDALRVERSMSGGPAAAGMAAQGICCRTCHPNWWGFYVCPQCGNKRCPKATDHRNTCTNSNEPGQKGSVYE